MARKAGRPSARGARTMRGPSAPGTAVLRDPAAGDLPVRGGRPRGEGWATVPITADLLLALQRLASLRRSRGEANASERALVQEAVADLLERARAR